MSDEKPESGKKGNKRMVDTNVRVTKSTHSRLKYLAEVLGVTMSEAVDAMIYEKDPAIDEKIEAREREIKEFRKKLKGGTQD